MNKPVGWVQLLTALGGAAIVAALLAGLVTHSPISMAIVLVAVLAFEVIVVLPIYLALHWKGWVSRNAVLACGFILGAAPWMWIAWPAGRRGSYASSNGVETLVDGVPTLAGWWDYGLAVALFGAFGLLVAAAFWAVLGSRITARTQAAKAMPEAPATPSQRKFVVLGRAIAVVAVIGVILALPYFTLDRSCHNVFRDRPVYSLGGASARPKVNFYIPAALPKDWNQVAQLLVGFGKGRSLDVQNLTEKDEHSQQLYVSLCNEGGTVISVLDRVYFFGPPMTRSAEQQIVIFGQRAGSDWREQAAALEVVLREKYGDAVRRVESQ